MARDEVESWQGPRGALYCKRPANVATVPERRELMTAGYVRRAALMAEVQRLERAGRVERLSSRARWNEEFGRWEIPVRRLKDGPPRWRGPLLALAAVALVLGLIWWALSTLAATIGLVALGGILVLFAVLVFSGGRRSGHSITIINNVTIK